jgi:hypothetical protein
MKKQMKKLKLAKETLQRLDTSRESIRAVVGGLQFDRRDTKSVYWSCVPTDSGMYTCAC